MLNIWTYYWNSYIRRCILSRTKDIERCYFSSVVKSLREELIKSGYVDSLSGRSLSRTRFAFKVMCHGKVSTYILERDDNGWKVVS